MLIANVGIAEMQALQPQPLSISFMAKIHHETSNVGASALRTLVTGVLLHSGLCESNAAYVADYLVETNLRGTDSHGVARLAHYVRRLEGKSITPNPQMTFQSHAPSAGVVDGNHGLGQLVMREAAEHAVKMARSTGAGWVSVKNSSHCGALAPLGIWIAEQNMIGFVFSHVDPMVLPFGSSQAFCGTNPLCITAPGNSGRSLCLDIATSIVPWNIVANAAQEGVSIPRGWAVNASGKDTEAPKEVAALYPFGEHKGSGLGVMADVLCALLSDSPYGPDIPRMYGDMTEHRRLGGLIGALSIGAFTNVQRFGLRVEEIMTRLGQLRPAEGVEKVQFPGEPELGSKAQRIAHGIPVGCQLLAELNSLAEACGLPRLRPI